MIPLRFESPVVYTAKSHVSLAFVFRTARAIISPRVVCFMQAVQARRAARRERVFRDGGNPLDTIGTVTQYNRNVNLSRVNVSRVNTT